MQKVRAQASKLWTLITAPSTASTYGDVFTLTWSIIKEFGLLLWLIFCIVLVAGEWIWTNAFNAGRGLRNSVNRVGQPSENEVGTGQSLVSASKASAAKVLAAAKGQLGIDSKS
jgi:hypothetical protein